MAFLSSVMIVRQKINPVCDYSFLKAQFVLICSDDWFVHSLIELFWHFYHKSYRELRIIRVPTHENSSRLVMNRVSRARWTWF